MKFTGAMFSPQLQPAEPIIQELEAASLLEVLTPNQQSANKKALWSRPTALHARGFAADGSTALHGGSVTHATSSAAPTTQPGDSSAPVQQWPAEPQFYMPRPGDVLHVFDAVFRHVLSPRSSWHAKLVTSFMVLFTHQAPVPAARSMWYIGLPGRPMVVVMVYSVSFAIMAWFVRFLCG